ncbi:hypothetical protein [Massilia yuzhufengensis]|uniref:Uncharacterized protein n=1 Tax=Massilia yuzhufengensis TaxID=1164594 RepID=A0A1I1G9T9_9BURK|nr:hypothetical protein [Massilia yuzhufengensis]SFC08052.1 hypothetical protein SAMN05216204_103230 [Massilia yuzhufengensis]
MTGIIVADWVVYVILTIIVIMTTRQSTLDAYVFEVLMPDLIGHDRRPAAFIVYLFLLHSTETLGRD